jgi:hypothetical protein
MVFVHVAFRVCTKVGMVFAHRDRERGVRIWVKRYQGTASVALRSSRRSRQRASDRNERSPVSFLPEDVRVLSDQRVGARVLFDIDDRRCP